jgi:uncharacterized membrane protein
MRKSQIALWAIVIAAFAVSFYFEPQAPDRMVTHWGVDGQPDGYMDKVWGLFLIPCMMAGLSLLFKIIPNIDPLKANVEIFRGYFDVFVVLIMVFLLNIHVIALLWNVGMELSISLLVSIWLAVIFYVAGVLMKKSKRNWFIGVRTPWTLSSDRVWDKTNQRAGTLFQVAAPLMMLIFLLGDWFFLVFIALIGVLGFYIVAYSYSEYQKEQKSKQ